jgi:hypothetical protein
MKKGSREIAILLLERLCIFSFNGILMIRSLLLLLVLSLFSACSFKIKNTEGFKSHTLDYRMSSDELSIINYRVQDDSLTPHMFRIFSTFSNNLPVNNLLGKDESQIRFWLSSGDSLKLIVLGKNGVQLTSDFYQIHVQDDSLGNFKSLSYKKTVGYPKSDWSCVDERLNQLGIYKLKNYHAISGYYGCIHGEYVAIQIINQESSRLFFYSCFEIYKKDLPEIIKINLMLTLLRKEFDFQIPE